MDQYRDGMRAGTGWEEHVDGLRSRFAIADLQSRCGPWQGDEGGKIDRIGGLDRTCQRKHRESGNQARRHGTILNVKWPNGSAWPTRTPNRFESLSATSATRAVLGSTLRLDRPVRLVDEITSHAGCD